MKKLLLFIFLVSTTLTFSQSIDQQKAETYLKAKGEVTFSFKVKNTAELNVLATQMSIVNFNAETKTVKVWANSNQFNSFLSKNIPFQVEALDNESRGVEMTSSINARANTLTFPLAAYPTYADYAQQMQDFATDNPGICELVDFGGTGEGAGGGNKRLLLVKLSDNIAIQENEPKMLYTSSMHGDEIAGFPMMLDLIDYFITAYKNTGHSDHNRVKDLLDNSEIWINPMANPDGTYYNSASNTSVANARRGNVNNLDLNRNYPDNVGGAHPDGEVYQTETIAFMNLADANNFVLSANFHGGIEVVNYPWDNTYDRHPDDAWFQLVSREYADNAQANSPNGYMDDLNNGITHGADWYRVEGGRQDYMNHDKHTKELTIELSNIKTPAANQLVNHWNYNREALIDYLVQGTYGFTGVVKDAVSGNPIDATVKIVGHDALGSWTTTNLTFGDYYRPVKAGTYDIIFEAPCYQSFTLNSQSISDYQTVTLSDVLLTPIGAVAPTGLAASNIGATTATLSWDAIAGATYDVRHREIGAQNWITTAESSTSVTPSGLSALTQYEAQVRSKCTGGTNSPYSSSVNFTTIDVQLNYCASASTNINDEYIGRVQINTIDNASGGQFYTDFTSQLTTLTKDEQYTITVTPTWTGTIYNEGYSVWIDYNRDGDFNDAGEQVWTQSSTKTTPVSGNFTIPTTAVESSTRMRVSMKYNGVPSSCETFTYGEVEDYTINIESSTPDTTAPVITLVGASPINLSLGDSYADQGATATDDIDGDITANIITAGDIVNTSIAATYVVTYNVSDTAGNAATEVTRTIIVAPDTTIPIITLSGPSTINLIVGETYNEQGATATDNVDGDITANIVIAGDVVNTNAAGTYIVTYNVSDASGNAAIEVIRTVIITPDTIAPVITLLGATPINLSLGNIYTEEGATALDNIDGDITANIVIAGDVVDTNVAGTYMVTFNVSDTAGNAAIEVTRTVIVAPDTTAPIITLIGATTINLIVGNAYTEQGATAIDDLDGDITANIVIAGDVVDTNSEGTYVVTYNVSDTAGNAATEVARTVIVALDTTAPIIALIGASSIVLELGDTYTEQGATATDDQDGDITANIVIAGDTVDTDVAGAYVITYNVSDAAGNAATEVTRTITVNPDTTAPVITLNGASPVDLNVGDSYAELGATASDNIDRDITANIVIAGDVVNINVAGTYEVTYNVGDTAGNDAIEVIRTVNVNEIITDVILHQGYFESGWDGWSDGGSDCARRSDAARSYEGNYSIRIRDNSGTASAMTLSNIDVAPYSEVEIDFHFYVHSMENNEDFWLRFYDGSSWATVATWTRGVNINNNTFYNGTITITAAQYNFAANSGFRFQNDASGNNDQIFIDQVTITGKNNAAARKTANRLVELGTLITPDSFEDDFLIYPNPVKNILNIELAEGDEFKFTIKNILGQDVQKGKSRGQVNVRNLKSGMYFIEVNDGEELMTKKFIRE